MRRLPPLANALGRTSRLTPVRNTGHPLIVIFCGFDRAYLGQLLPENRARTVGCAEAEMPAGAPSRSTLKLEEAWHVFLEARRWYDYLGGGKVAVDLGAAPGGWTWRLVQQGMNVVAVDNGEMTRNPHEVGSCHACACDGFTFRPQAGRLDGV